MMNEQELATLWCALNCAQGRDADKMVLLVMKAIERRIGDAGTRWNELKGRLDRITEAVKQIN